MKRVGAGWAEGGSSHKISLTILTMLHSHVSVCRAKFFWFCNVFTMFTCSSNVCVQNPDPVYIFWHIASWSNRACKICKSCMWFLVSPCLFKKFWDQRCLLSWTFQAFVIATMVILKRVMCFRICVLSSFSAVSFLLLRCCVFSIFHHVMCFRSVSRAFVCASPSVSSMCHQHSLALATWRRGWDTSVCPDTNPLLLKIVCIKKGFLYTCSYTWFLHWKIWL